MKNYQKQIYDKYITSGYFKQNTDLSDKKIKKEFNFFDRNIFSHLSKNRKSKILEIGFGTGIFLKYLKDNGFSNFEGIEVGKEQFRFVKNNITRKVHLVGDTLNFLGKKNNFYDAIIMLDVLEHIPKNQIFEFIIKVRSSLKKNGKLILRVPNGSNSFNIDLFYADFTHETIFTEKSIRQIAKTLKFSDVTVFGAKEENISFHGKITNISQKISFFFMKLIIQFQRLHFEDSPLNKNIIGVLTK